MTIVQPVPWGRTLAEYRAMFSLGGEDRASRVLDVAAGPASFVAEWAATGGRAVACDPLYAVEMAGIGERLDKARDAVRALVAGNVDRFVWRTFRDVDDLIAARLAAADRFLADYGRGRAEGRYVAASLPSLPFADQSFDLALSSHFLFLYSDAFGADLHAAALTELGRVAREVRVFPLLAMDGRPSPHLAPVTASLRQTGHDAAVEMVDYEIQRGGNEMLRVRRSRQGLVSRRSPTAPPSPPAARRRPPSP